MPAVSLINRGLAEVALSPVGPACACPAQPTASTAGGSFGYSGFREETRMAKGLERTARPGRARAAGAAAHAMWNILAAWDASGGLGLIRVPRLSRIAVLVCAAPPAAVDIPGISARGRAALTHGRAGAVPAPRWPGSGDMPASRKPGCVIPARPPVTGERVAPGGSGADLQTATKTAANRTRVPRVPRVPRASRASHWLAPRSGPDAHPPRFYRARCADAPVRGTSWNPSRPRRVQRARRLRRPGRRCASR